VPPPLVPMVLHAAAEDPTAAIPPSAIENSLVYARILVRLIPSVSSSVQHRACERILAYLTHCDRNSGLAFLAEAQSAGFFPRAAAMLLSAWKLSAEPCQFRTASTTAVLVLRALTFFESSPDFVDAGVLEPIVARLGLALQNAEDAATCEAACLGAVTTAAKRNANARDHLIGLGAIHAVARRPLDAERLDALYYLTATRPEAPADVPDSVISSLGVCLMDTGTAGEKPSLAAASVLCNVIGSPAQARRVAVLFAVPGVPEHLYGKEGSLDWATRPLAATCGTVNRELTARAVAAGLLRPATIVALLDVHVVYVAQDFIDAARSFEIAVRLAPKHAAEAMRNGVPLALARALATAARFEFEQRGAVLQAAANCLAAMAEECDASDAVSECIAVSGIVEALNEVLVENRRLSEQSVETKRELRAANAAVVAAADALARHHDEAFAREAAALAPQLEQSLARHRQSLGADDNDRSTSTSPASPDAELLGDLCDA